MRMIQLRLLAMVDVKPELAISCDQVGLLGDWDTGPTIQPLACNMSCFWKVLEVGYEGATEIMGVANQCLVQSQSQSHPMRGSPPLTLSGAPGPRDWIA